MAREANDVALTPAEFEKRGYNKDIMPKTSAQRNNSAFNFFTLWMGAVHNMSHTGRFLAEALAKHPGAGKR